MARRPEVEVFGMSMMDTVTCGLGAAIILMLLIASMIPQRAKILFTHQEAVVSADDSVETSAIPEPAESRKNAIGILSLIYTNGHRDVPLAADSEAEVIGYALSREHDRGTCTSSQSQDSQLLRKLMLANPEVTFTGEPSPTINYVFWWVGDEASMEKSVGCIELKMPQFGRSCKLRIIADAQQTMLSYCPDKLFFKRSVEGIYELVHRP